MPNIVTGVLRPKSANFYKKNYFIGQKTFKLTNKIQTYYLFRDILLSKMREIDYKNDINFRGFFQPYVLIV